VTIAVNPIAIGKRLIEQAIVREKPLEHGRAAALRRPANGDRKAGSLERKEAMIRAGRAD
jgi:hypothetical protein